MRLVYLLLLFVLSAPVWATNWYVCPDQQTEHGLEDGTSLANCFDGNADISWASINPGDTLYLCGHWGTTDARITVADSGTAGNYIRLSGNAAACGQTINSSISREGIAGTNGRAISASNTGANRAYIKIEDITLKDCSDYCILWEFSTTGAVTDDTSLWINRVEFERCGATGVPVCLRHTGQNIIVENSTFHDMYNDAMWLRGGGVTDIHDNRISLISNGGIGGDGIQIDATGVTNTGTVYIYDNDIDHSDFDVKYCILVPGRGVSGIFVHHNTCKCPAVATNADSNSSCHGIVLDVRSTTVVRVDSNFVRYGRIGIGINGDPPSVTFATRGRIYNNIVIGAYSWGILTDGYINNFDVWNNIALGAGEVGIDIRKNSSDSADAIDIELRNNVMVSSPIGLSYGNQTPSPRGYNGYYDNDLDVEASGVDGTTTTGDVVGNPLWAGGDYPLTREGFRLSRASPLRGAGACYLAGACAYADEFGRRGKIPPDIGAFQRN